MDLPTKSSEIKKKKMRVEMEEDKSLPEGKSSPRVDQL